MLLRLLLTMTMLLATTANAQRGSTSDALERMKEAMRAAVEEGFLQGMVPVILVSAAPAYEDTRAWFPAAVVAATIEVFGQQNLRVCEACMNPRVSYANGRLEHNSTSVSTLEAVQLDTSSRGAAAPARVAMWVDETPGGVAVRVTSLETDLILFAGNFDGGQLEKKQTASNFSATADLERRLRGDSLTHIFIDAAVYPGQHFSVDVVDQFGDRNLNLAGLTVSAWDPLIGVGAAYYRVIPEAFNLTVGAKVIASIPTIAVNAISDQNNQLIDPPLTGVLVVRWPIFDTNYAILGTASTNGRVGLGITLMNFSFLPVLP
jgi:hypothetical protein